MAPVHNLASLKKQRDQPRRHTLHACATLPREPIALATRHLVAARRDGVRTPAAPTTAAAAAAPGGGHVHEDVHGIRHVHVQLRRAGQLPTAPAPAATSAAAPSPSGSSGSVSSMQPYAAYIFGPRSGGSDQWGSAEARLSWPVREVYAANGIAAAQSACCLGSSSAKSAAGGKSLSFSSRAAEPSSIPPERCSFRRAAERRAGSYLGVGVGARVRARARVRAGRGGLGRTLRKSRRLWRRTRRRRPPHPRERPA